MKHQERGSHKKKKTISAKHGSKKEMIKQMGTAMVQAYDNAEDKLRVCYLCKRDRPVFTGDNLLMRLPVSSLSPFLRQLKID